MKQILYWVIAATSLSSTQAANLLNFLGGNDKQEYTQEEINNKWLAFAKQGDRNSANELRNQYQIEAIQVTDEYGNNALHYACLHSGSIKMINWLLDVCKIGIETKGRYRITPFLCTARIGQLELAKLLKERGANIIATDKDRNNALHHASLFSSNVAMINWLLDECKIGTETKGQYQKTPFLCAAGKGQLTIAKLLRQRGANVKAKDTYGNNALHLACFYSGSVDMVNWLLDECNLGLEAKEEYQKTSFLCAANKGQLSIAKLLRQRGANVNAKDKDGNNALHYACLYSGSEVMVNWLLDECKTNVEAKGRDKINPFLCAVGKGQLAIVKLLRQRSANVKAKDTYGNNALHYACRYSGSEATVNWLLDTCKISIEAKGRFQKTPFIFAVERGYLPIAKLLKQRGANIHAKDEGDNNALHYACLFSGSVPMTNWLLDSCKLGIETKGCNQKTPFICAAEKGYLAIAKLLRQRGANIHAKDQDGNNALHYACRYSGSEAMINWLLDECRLGIETRGYYQKTPFLCAAEQGQFTIAKLLRLRGANINAQDEDGENALNLTCRYSENETMITWLLDVCHIGIETAGQYGITPFLFAMGKGQFGIAKLLKQRGADITAKDVNGNNALHYVCRYSGSVAIAIWLLEKCRAPIETKGRHQKTPFLSAAEKGQFSMVELLRQRGANLNAKDDQGNNALHLACRYSDKIAMINWLLDTCKIGIETKGQSQKTPFLCAAEKGQLHIAKLLKQRNASITVKNAYGDNALHYACRYSGSVEMINWLLDVCKIGIETQGQSQKTPFIFAAQEGQLNIAKLLKQRGAIINRKNAYGDNALHYACRYSGSEEMINWLLDECNLGLETQGRYGITPFLFAAQEGQLNIANLLKQRGADINAKNTYDNNALHLACFFSGNVAMTTWLLDECKIGLETKGRYQRTPFLFAAEKGQLAIAKLLKQRGANVNAKSEHGNTALHYTCLFSESEAMVTWLLDECKLGLETKGQFQRTPFLCTMERGQLNLAKLLRHRSADVNAKDEYGNNALLHTCLHADNVAIVAWLLDVCRLGIETKGQYNKTSFLCAAQEGHLNVAKLLKQRGADIKAEDGYGNNALHWASLFSDSEAMITWLLDQCQIGIETTGCNQITPFLCATERGQLNIAKLLKQRGANINAEDEFGNNALHWACLYSDSVATINWLLDVCNIGIETEGRSQKTPFLCAVTKGQLPIAKLLKQRGANINAKDNDENDALSLASESPETLAWLQTI